MADNLSLLSAVLSFGYGDTHAASGIPSRRVYTLTERSAAAWSELLRLATVGGDVYSATERPGAIDAAVAFVEAVPTERLGRMQRAQASKLLKRLATAKVSAMARHANPEDGLAAIMRAMSEAIGTLKARGLRLNDYLPSVTIIAPFKRGQEPLPSAARKGYQQALRTDGTLLSALYSAWQYRTPAIGRVSGEVGLTNGAEYIGLPADRVTAELSQLQVQRLGFVGAGGRIETDFAGLFATLGAASHTDSKVSAMTRRSNPSESVRIMRSANPAKTSDALATVRRYFPSATVSRTDSDGSRRTAYVGRLGPARGEPGTEHARIVWIEPGAASVRIRVYRYADPRIDRTLSAHVLVSERVVEPADLGAALAAVIAEQGNGARTGNPADGISISKLIQAYPAETAAIGFNAANPYAPAHTRALRQFADLLRRKLEAAYRKDVAVSFQDGRDLVGYAGFNPIGGDLDEIVRETLQELAGGARTGNPSDDFDTLERNFDAAAAKSVSARQAYQKAYGQEALQRGAWMHSNTAKAKALRNALAEEREAFRAWAGEDAERQAYGNAPMFARTGNPPALIWEFDGEPTSPKELLADNPDNGDVAAAVAYLKAEGAKFSMGRHGTKGVRSWSAVSFGGGAADESVLTVRADWTDGPVFKAVLDASTIPYAGDLPDAD